VITHGEPHAANVIDTPAGLRLIDWDTVALAPRERDLWMMDDGAADPFDAYMAATGVEVDPAAIELYRLEWTLGDLASFAARLRSDHDDNADTRRALDGFATYLTQPESRDRSATSHALHALGGSTSTTAPGTKPRRS
jgi:aminoglycoside phosphotransferase (APT) family kinase protein